MSDLIPHIDWEIAPFAIASVGTLLVSLFRLDELMAAPKRRAQVRRMAPGLNGNGEATIYDPDGRTWSRTGRDR